MAKHDKYKLYGELAKILYGWDCTFNEIHRILAAAFTAAEDIAPPCVETIGKWYKDDKAAWDAERAVDGKPVHVAIYDIFANILKKCHKNEAFALENADVAAKWLRNWRDAKAVYAEDKISGLRMLTRDADKSTVVDKPAIFIEHLGFIFDVLPEDSAAHKSLAEQYESIIEKYKDHVAAQANHRA